MVVDDLDCIWPRLRPGKTDPVLGVDPNAELTLSISQQRFQTVAGGYLEVLDTLCGVELL
jgi:hypothetical protein